MAHQHNTGAYNQKTSRKVLNFVEIFVFRGPFAGGEQASSKFSATMYDSSSSERQGTSRGRCVRFTNGFAHKQALLVHKAWQSVCNALSKHEVLSQKELVEPQGPFTECPLDDKCSHQNKLEALPSLGKHILLYMSEKSLTRGHASLHAEPYGGCGSGLKSDSVRNKDEEFAPTFVGIFLQTHITDRVHLAHRLVDSGRARRRLHNLAFARLQGEPGMICSTSSQPQVDYDKANQGQQCKESTPLLFAASSHKHLLRSFKQQILRAVPLQLQQQNFPDKEMLTSVQDFFMYTEFEGKKVFEELDRDSDGKLTLDDLAVAMKRMKLPIAYAKDFMQSKHRLWHAKYFGWSDFSSLLQEKEPVIVQLYNSLGVSKSGIVESSHVKDSLVKSGLSATEANVTAMMNFLAEDVSCGLKYGQFRRFMLLLPTKQLTQDPWSVWLKAATTHGVEPLSEGLQQLPALNYVSLVSRNITHHFDSMKERPRP